MTREDFKVVPKLYATNTLTYIVYNKEVIGFVETWMNYGYVEDDKGKFKSNKKKRPQASIDTECESIIKKFIKNN